MSRDEQLRKAAELENVGTDLAQSAAGRFLHPRLDIEARVLQLLASGAVVPVLVGEQGSGKTSLAERVALILGSFGPLAPEALRGYRIIVSDPATLLSEAIYASQIESKLIYLMQNATKGKCILFLDEIQTFAGSGSSSENEDGDILTLLVPHIKRTNGLRVMASTTLAGWVCLQQRRPLFAQRCVPVHMSPMTEHDVRRVLYGHAANIATTTGLSIEETAIDAALELARVMQPGSQPPGGACDILQGAVAYQLARFEQDENAISITSDVIVASLHAATGLPRFLLSQTDVLPLAEIRRVLGQRVIGQESAVTTIADRINLIQHGLCAAGGRPLGVFLLTGPTGVGKTELAKTVAALMHGGDDAIIRFDMSEYSQPDSVYRFIGTRFRNVPSGVGLVHAVLGRPFPVILLDEIEKAHESIFDVLLQVFGEARLTDGRRTARFDTALFLLSSNVCVTERSIGFTTAATVPISDTSIPDAVRAFWRPELVNRITGVVAFQSLARDVIREICRREVASLASRSGLQRRGLVVSTTEAALEALITLGYSREFGARPMQRAIDRHVGAAIASLLELRSDAADAAILVHTDPVRGGFTTSLVKRSASVLHLPISAGASYHHAPSNEARTSDSRPWN